MRPHVCHANAIDDIAKDGEDDIHDCELGGEPDERLCRFSSSFPLLLVSLFIFSSAPFVAALERKVGERGHQDHGGVRDDRLEDVLVPAGGEAKKEAG